MRLLEDSAYERIVNPGAIQISDQEMLIFADHMSFVLNVPQKSIIRKSDLDDYAFFGNGSPLFAQGSVSIISQYYDLYQYNTSKDSWTTTLKEQWYPTDLKE